MARTDEVLKDALALKPAEKAEIIDKLLSSLDKPEAELDAAWEQEVETRIDAFERGAIEAVANRPLLPQLLYQFPAHRKKVARAPTNLTRPGTCSRVP